MVASEVRYRFVPRYALFLFVLVPVFISCELVDTRQSCRTNRFSG